MPLRPDLELPVSRLRPSFPPVPTKPEALPGFAGQERAREAINFALAITGDGYNIAIAGPRASGRHALAVEILSAAAAGRPDARDWVYLHNFEDQRRPRALQLPAGRGPALARGLDGLARACREALPTAFASESYERRVQEVLAPELEARARTLDLLQNTARALGFTVSAGPMGLMAAPLRADGEPMAAEDFEKLPEEVRAPIEKRGEQVQEAIATTLRTLRQLDERAHAAVKDLDREITRFVIGPALEELQRDFAGLGLEGHLVALSSDVVEHLDIFKRFAAHQEGLPPQLLAQFQQERDEVLLRYRANVFVTREPGGGAPVIHETQPTYQNVFGMVEFENRMGNFITDFLHIRPGAIHRANGGYIVLQVEDLLGDPRAWPKLKRTLTTREVRFDDTMSGFILPVAGLAPEGIPLDLKVALVGPSMVFALMGALDPDFSQLFKVNADFEPDTPADAAGVTAYASFVQQTCQEAGLLPFDTSAVEELLNFGSRMADRQDRLSTRMGAIADLCSEGNHYAAGAGAATVGGSHVAAAIDARRHRQGLVPDRIRQMIAERTLRIETSGSVVGQVNGLAVVSAGGDPFGLPMRITCRTGAGRGGVVDIERETERSGSIHTKGVLVLQGYLMGLFGAEEPLTFNASLTFEQSYDEVEGDSASAAELCAILASLADLPVRQDIAMTGSVDQLGNVQAVGGVTHKVEGFYDVCAAAGLTGSQGVVIPEANVINLNLRRDLATAVQEGRFHLWAIRRVEEAVELLTGREAGAPDQEGAYPEESVFGLVAERLAILRENAAEAATVAVPVEVVAPPAAEGALAARANRLRNEGQMGRAGRAPTLDDR